MNWKQSLDKYLTSSPPDDGFTDYFEAITESMSDQFFNNNEDWILNSVLMNDWADKLFIKGIDPMQSAIIIERAFRLTQ